MDTMTNRDSLPDWNALARLGDDELPLLDTALLIARDEYPDLDIAAYESLCDGLERDLRPPDQGVHRLGNYFGLVPLVLPVGVANPVERVYEVRRRMAALARTRRSRRRPPGGPASRPSPARRRLNADVSADLTYNHYLEDGIDDHLAGNAHPDQDWYTLFDAAADLLVGGIDVDPAAGVGPQIIWGPQVLSPVAGGKCSQPFR